MKKKLLFIFTYGLVGLPFVAIGFVCRVVATGYFVGVHWADELLKQGADK
jgi:hypothetical protein